MPKMEEEKYVEYQIPLVFPFNLYSHNHIYIAKYLFSIRDD